jgi:heterodisulfide reductase subunit D
VTDLQNVIRDTKIRLCLDCGKCTVVCPVSKYDPNFNPRLIVQGTLRRNGKGLKDERVWSCINCNMCMERCNYNVKFTDFIRSVRSVVIEEGGTVQCSHGGAAQAVMHMMGQGSIKQSRLTWLSKDIKVQDKGETAFFVGCAPYFDVLFKDLNVRTTDGSNGALRLLNHVQVPFTLLLNERCCGRDLLLLGDMEGFMNLAQANLEEFSKQGIRNVITACPECYHTLKVDYPHYLKQWNIEVTHITEVIAPLTMEKLPIIGKNKRRITYHDPCTLGRYSRIFEPPRSLIATMPGTEVVEMSDSKEKALCCGATPWAHCGFVNKQIQKERLEQAEATGAELLITACPKCLIHLKCAQNDKTGQDISQIEIKDLYDVLSTSLLP